MSWLKPWHSETLILNMSHPMWDDEAAGMLGEHLEQPVMIMLAAASPVRASATLELLRVL